MEAPLAPRALPRAPAVAPGTRGSARRPRLPQLWQPLCLVAAVRARRALPGRHLIQDTWYHKVGHPETCAGEDVSMEQQPVHLLQGHRDSYLHFMRHLFPKELSKRQKDLRLTDDSYVLVPLSEAESRGVERKEVAPGLCAVKLGSLLSPLSQGRRFSTEMVVEKMYYVEDPDSAEIAERDRRTYSCRVMVPVKITDASTRLSIEAHLELGEIPVMTEFCTFIVSGNPYIIAHRLERSSGVYFEQTENEQGPVQTLELVTEEYSRIRCVCQVSKQELEEIFFRMPKSSERLPAALMLLAMGLSEVEIRGARNGEWLWSHGGGPMELADEDPVEFACRDLCQRLKFDTERFQNDYVAAFSFKTSWSLSSRVGPLGRERLNQRLGLKLTEENLTPKDFLATVDLLADSFRGIQPLQSDNIDSLVNKRLRPVGLKMQNMVRDWLASLVNKASCIPICVDSDLSARVVTESQVGLLKFCIAQLWKENNRQLFEQLNPLSELMQARRITQVSELGLDKIKRIQSIRLINPTQYGRVCAVETGEGMSAGIVQALASSAHITHDGELLAPHQRVVQGVRQLEQPWDFLSAKQQLDGRVANVDLAHGAGGALLAPARSGEEHERPSSVTVTQLGNFSSCAPELVEYIACAPPVSVAVGLIPFLEHDDANRLLMGAKHQQQSVPTLWPERPVVGTGMEAHVATYSGRCQHAGLDGHVLYADAQAVTVLRGEVRQAPRGLTELRAELRELYLSCAEREWLQGTSYQDFNELLLRLPEPQLARLARCGAQERQALLARGFRRAGLRPHVRFEEAPEAEELPEHWRETEYTVEVEMRHKQLVDCTATKKHVLAHDTGAVVVGEAVCAGDALAEGQGICGGEAALGKNLVVAYMPFGGYNYEDAIAISARLVREDVLTSVHVDEIEMELEEDQFLCSPPWDEEGDESVLTRPLDYMPNGLAVEGTWLEEGDVAIYSEEGGKERSQKLPVGVRGRVIESRVTTLESIKFGKVRLQKVAQVLIAVQCRIGVGDKLSGRHGNKGIVSIVEEDRDMPFLPDGTPIDVCLNPLGVPSRMNVGQIFENLLGSAGRWNGEEYRVGPFDEMFADEASRGLVFDALRRAQEGTGYKWLLDSEYRSKTKVYDGRTGMPLEQPVTVGVSYIIKLCHMVRDKIHSRTPASGAYNNLTQQPIKGRSRGGGLRLGEMEVSGLAAYGASATLQELVTVKSDDLQGRAETFQRLKRGEELDLPAGATPEGYLTFRRELEASALAISEGSWLEDDHEG